MNDQDRGLYHKYTVIKNTTGEPIEEACFILIPNKDPAAVEAILAYAGATENKQLAEDLRKWVTPIPPRIGTYLDYSR